MFTRAIEYEQKLQSERQELKMEVTGEFVKKTRILGVFKTREKLDCRSNWAFQKVWIQTEVSGFNL